MKYEIAFRFLSIFLAGCVAYMLSAVINEHSLLVVNINEARLVVAPIFEEVLKLCFGALLSVLFKENKRTQYAIGVAMVYATLEAISYVNAYDSSSIALIAARFLVSMPMHIIAAYIGSSILPFTIVAIVYHSLYNHSCHNATLLSTILYVWAPMIVVGVIYVVRQYKAQK